MRLSNAAVDGTPKAGGMGEVEAEADDTGVPDVGPRPEEDNKDEKPVTAGVLVPKPLFAADGIGEEEAVKDDGNGDGVGNEVDVVVLEIDLGRATAGRCKVVALAIDVSLFPMTSSNPSLSPRPTSASTAFETVGGRFAAMMRCELRNGKFDSGMTKVCLLN